MLSFPNDCIIMKFPSLIVTAWFTAAVSAFTPPSSLSNSNALSTSSDMRVSPLASFFGGGGGGGGAMGGATMAGTIDVTDEFAQRDVQGMEQWALQNGVQKVDGVELTSGDGVDWQLVANQGLAAGSPVLYVPSGMVLSSNAVCQEFGQNLQAAENALVQEDKLTAQRLPLFRLFVKILVEYEKGQDSIYFPWLNSLPRRYFNGVAMTSDCFDCLPPYAGWLASSERANYLSFRNALRKGYISLQQNTLSDDRITQWAYNVAFTRFTEVWQPSRQKLIAPMADMFNHGSNPNVEITFDDGGNCIVNTIDNVPAGAPLTISLGDPTNPTPLFAKYGFLSDDCRTIFCKAMHLKPQIDELGYDFKDLLFQVDSGEIAPKVYDIFLLKILQENDPGLAAEFYTACKTNDENAKQNFHGQYFQYTLNALQTHVGSILNDVDRLTQKAQSLDVATHPRVPVIVAHNNLVRETFSRTQANLQNMG